MRRPAPLPADAAKPTPSARTRRTRDAQGIQDVEADASAAVDADATAEVVPIDQAIAQDEHRQATEADAAATPSPGADGELTGRDLWRAARARRRALRAEIRRFTQRSRRRRVIWLSVLGALVLFVGGSALAAYSPLFAVEQITVAGTDALDAASVQEALSSQQGRPLALVDSSEVKEALTAFPLIETYALEVRPPHELVVRITERTPVGVLASDAGYSLVDAAGVILSTTPTAPEGYPKLEITGGLDSRGFRAAGTVVRSLSADLRAGLVTVRASSGDDVTLILSGDTTVIWGSPEDSAQKSMNLSAIMKAVPDARSYDVSSTEAVAVR